MSHLCGEAIEGFWRFMHHEASCGSHGPKFSPCSQDELGRCEHEIFEARGILVGLGDVPPSLTPVAEPKPKPAAKKRQGKKTRPESF